MSLDRRRSEFSRFIWDHAADAFQMSFDERREFSSDEVRFIQQIHHAALIPEEEKAVSALRLILQNDLDKFSIALQIVGLTRNKIISDLRGNSAVAAQNIVVPSSFKGIPDSSAWKLAGPYLLKRLRAVLGIIDPKQPTLEQCYQALNQSTWPGYIRQERAKRSGHEAESRLATLLFSLGIDFAPAEKAENPLCRDVQIDDISFDLVVPNAKKPLVVFKSTVHTANISQYGESKDHLEIDEARRWLDALKTSPRPKLVAFIDGVGFRSNRAGLDGVLSKSDEFCQFRTIWKAAIIAGHAVKRKKHILLPRAILAEFKPFIEKYEYLDLCSAREDTSEVVGFIEAGDALIQR